MSVKRERFHVRVAPIREREIMDELRGADPKKLVERVNRSLAEMARQVEEALAFLRNQQP